MKTAKLPSGSGYQPARAIAISSRDDYARRGLAEMGLWQLISLVVYLVVCLALGLVVGLFVYFVLGLFILGYCARLFFTGRGESK